MTDVPAQLNAIADNLDTAAGIITNISGDVTTSATSLRIAASLWDPAGTIAQLEADLADALQAITDLQADLAAAQTELQITADERDAALAQIAALQDQVAQLEADLAACQGGGDPTPEVSGPVGMTVGQIAPAGDYYNPSIASLFVDPAGLPLTEGDSPGQTRSRGTAELVAVSPTRLQVISDEANATDGATAEWRQYLFRARTQTATFEFTRQVVTPVSDGVRTFKGPGLGHYVWGNASEFPAGGQTSDRFALIRACGWNWTYPDVAGDDRLTLVWRTGSQHADEVTGWQIDNTATQVPARIVPTEYTDGYTATSMIDRWDHVPTGVDITLRIVASWGTPGVSDGWVDLYGHEAGQPWEWLQHLENFRWVDQAMNDGLGEGFSLALPDIFYGGPAGDPTYVPDNAARAGVHEFEGFKVWAGEIRPI